MKDKYVHPREQAPGIELRDWFAGMALSGLVVKHISKTHKNLMRSDYAALAYDFADEMMEERERER